MPKQVFLLLGANLGNCEETFNKAALFINAEIGTVKKQSAVYISEPWGFETDDMFRNQALMLETELSAHQVLHKCLDIENRLGRTRSANKNYESRMIDIDILFYENTVVDDEMLTIPHPLLHLRNFALIPLCEIAPQFVHPKYTKSVEQLLQMNNRK